MHCAWARVMLSSLFLLRRLLYSTVFPSFAAMYLLLDYYLPNSSSMSSSCFCCRREARRRGQLFGECPSTSQYPQYVSPGSWSGPLLDPFPLKGSWVGFGQSFLTWPVCPQLKHAMLFWRARFAAISSCECAYVHWSPFEHDPRSW